MTVKPNTYIRRITLFLMISFLGWTVPSALTAADTITWRAQSSIDTNSWGYKYQHKIFADRVNKNAKGRLVIKVFPPGAIVGAYEMFDAVKRNAIQVGMGIGGYNLKQIPEAAIEQGMPGTFASPDEAGDFINYYNLGEAYDLINASYQKNGTYLLPSFGYSPSVLILKKPIKDVASIKGLKIRGSGENQALIKNLGASPVTLAPSEVYMAMQTGTIDGVIFPSYTIGTFKLWDVAKGILGPAFSQSGTNIFVNLEEWNKLSEELKWIVTEAALYSSHYHKSALRENLKAIMNTAVKEHGVTIVNLEADEYQKLVQAALPILDEVAQKNETSAKLIALLKEFLEKRK